MSNTNVRIISAATAQASAPNTHPTVNICTDTPDLPAKHPKKNQVTPAQASAAASNFPTVIAGPTGTYASLPKNGLPTIQVSGYNGPS